MFARVVVGVDGTVDAAPFEFDEEEHVEAVQRERLDGEEVAGEHAGGLLAEEFRASSGLNASALALNGWQAECA
jgi:hypothetical protein